MNEIVILKVVAVAVLAVLAMYLLKKVIESLFNLSVLFKASKDKNHSARVPSSGVVVNTETKKLEASGGDKTILPF